MRLQQYLSRAGITSRRKAEELIRAGRVTINGQVASIGAQVAEQDTVRLDGEKVKLSEKQIVIALNKPMGVTTTASDPHAEKTVLELVPHIPGLHPVGRLDKDTEGLLLLTNDGALTERLTHPRYGVHKVYRAWSRQGTLPPALCDKLVEGVELGDGLAKALEARPVKGGVRLVMAEGRKREVRRMLGSLGHPVERLVRTHIGTVALGELPLGEWRYLSAEEIKTLKEAAEAGAVRVESSRERIQRRKRQSTTGRKRNTGQGA